MRMKKYIGIGIAVMLAALTLAVLAGCSEYNHVVGSKNMETRQFDYSGFTRIEISNSFNVDITKSDTYSISVTLNDNLFNELTVSKSGDTLYMHMNPYLRLGSSTQRAEITLPELNSLKISGACQAVVTGFQSAGTLDLEADGASGMQINDLKATDTKITALGVSHVTGSLITDNADFQVTGVSNIKLTGSAAKMQLNVVGASHAALVDFIVGDASVTAEGASTVEIDAHGTLDVDVSGASTLRYSDNPKLGRVEVSGASTLSRR